MSRLFRFTIFILGICLILMALSIIAFPQGSVGVSELWAVTEPYSVPGFYIKNQHTGRTVDITGGRVVEVVGWSNDGQSFVYTDSNICGEGGCFPDGTLYAASVWGDEPRLLGELRLGTSRLKRSHDGRWYAQINDYNEVILFRDDGRERRLLTHLPSKFTEDWYAFWSPDDEWLYLAFGFRYQASLTMIFRVRPDEGVLQPVAQFEGFTSFSFHVDQEWLLLFATDSETDTNVLYRMRPDGSELSDGVEILDDINSLNYWVSPSGATFGFSRHYSFRPLYQIDTENGQFLPLVVGEGGQTLSSPHIQHAPSGHYLSGLFSDTGSGSVWEAGEWVVMDGVGDILLQHSIQRCEHFGTFWVNESVYTVEWQDDEKCRLLQYRPGDDMPRVAQEFPNGAKDFYVVSTDTGTWIAYSLNGTEYLATLDGRETTEIKLNENSSIQNWITIANPEADKRPAIPIGLGLIALVGLSARYKIVRR